MNKLVLITGLFWLLAAILVRYSQYHFPILSDMTVCHIDSHRAEQFFCPYSCYCLAPCKHCRVVCQTCQKNCYRHYLRVTLIGIQTNREILVKQDEEMIWSDPDYVVGEETEYYFDQKEILPAKTSYPESDLAVPVLLIISITICSLFFAFFLGSLFSD